MFREVLCILVRTEHMMLLELDSDGLKRLWIVKNINVIRALNRMSWEYLLIRWTKKLWAQIYFRTLRPSIWKMRKNENLKLIQYFLCSFFEWLLELLLSLHFKGNLSNLFNFYCFCSTISLTFLVVFVNLFFIQEETEEKPVNV